MYYRSCTIDIYIIGYTYIETPLRAMYMPGLMASIIFFRGCNIKEDIGQGMFSLSPD